MERCEVYGTNGKLLRKMGTGDKKWHVRRAGGDAAKPPKLGTVVVTTVILKIPETGTIYYSTIIHKGVETTSMMLGLVFFQKLNELSVNLPGDVFTGRTSE